MTRHTRHYLHGLAAAFALAASTPSLAGSQQGTSDAIVLRPLSVVNTADLDFGDVIRGTTAGTVTINASTNAVTATGGAISAGGSPHRATFLTTGLVNALFLLSFPATTATLTNGTGGTMTVNNLTLDGGTLRLFPAGGVATINVGGRLNVGANQAEGVYTGTFNLTVVYL